MEFTIGELAEARLEEMERHFDSCADCRMRASELADASACLDGMARQMRQGARVEEREIREAFRVWQERQSAGAAASQIVLWLELLIARLCGTRMARKAMQEAAAEAAALSAEQVTRAQWPVFIGKLSSILEALCGEPAARSLYAIGEAGI